MILERLYFPILTTPFENDIDNLYHLQALKVLLGNIRPLFDIDCHLHLK